MTSTAALAERPVGAMPAAELDLIRRTVANGATEAELKLFLFDCLRRGVHPLDKLLHFTKRGGKYTPVTSIDFMRSQAAASGEMAGSDDPVFYPSDSLESHPVTATVTVYRLTQGHRFAYSATARWAEYCPDNAPMWKRMPHTMLGKCAEALALRKAFPQQLAGLYTTDEMDQADNHSAPLVVTPLPAPRPTVQETGEPEKPSGANGGELAPLSIPPGYALIAEVRGSRAGSKGELVMQSGESFLFYKEPLKALAMEACQLQIPVQLTVKTSTSGNRYVDGLHKLPQPLTDAELDAELAKQEMAKQAGEVA